jgi:hypothetical protein
MPWDGTELRVGELGPDGTVTSVATVLGGPDESVLQPEWADADTLYAVSDRSGWWNLYRLPAGGGEPEPLCPRAEEFGQPAVAARHDDVRAAGRRAAGRPARHDTLALGVLDPATGELTDLDLPYTLSDRWTSTATRAHHGGQPGRAAGGGRGRPADRRVTVLRRSMAEPPDPAYLPQPRSIVVAGRASGTCTPRLPAVQPGRGRPGRRAAAVRGVRARRADLALAGDPHLEKATSPAAGSA